jgi:manganese-transporting P-type ATPase
MLFFFEGTVVMQRL